MGDLVMSGFSGMKAWLVQRYTAVYIALFVPYVSIVLWNLEPINHAIWAGLFRQPFMQVTTALFVVALLFHAWIGLRDVILDYIKPIGIKMLIVAVVIFTLFASGFWFLRALILVDIS
jgi:succinate dehydrogenase / fumarate reductase membrane anchor subunit